MNDDLDPLISPKVRVLRMLRQGIESGSLAPEDPVPSEKILAEHLHVTRSAVRAAFDILEAEGVVRMQGKGRVVAGTSGAPPERQKSTPSILLLGGNAGPVPSYMKSSGWAIHLQGAIENRLRAKGFAIKPVSIASVASEFERPATERPVGLIMLGDGGDNTSLFRALEGIGGVPRILYAASLDALESNGADTVVVDHAAGGAALIDWMVAHRRRNLQRVWLQVWNSATIPTWLALRDDGMRHAAERYGLTLPPTITVPWLPWVPPSEHFERFWHLGAMAIAGALARNLLGGHPVDGLLMMHDTAAIQAWSALDLLGTDFSQRLLVGGHDGIWADVPERHLESRPPSVSILRDMPAVGEALADLLLARLEGTAPPGRQTKIISPRIVEPI